MRSGASVATVEHLLAALAGLRIDNVLVEIDGPETPIMDGSAAEFVAAIDSVGVVQQSRPRRSIRIVKPLRVEFGDAYAELYLAEPNESARVALTRVGTRVIEDLSTLPGLDHVPWVSRYVQGLIDVPFLNLTPGTRSGIIQDERFAALVEALTPLEAHVKGLIEEQQRAEEE